MASKIWKRVLLAILIIACLFDITLKLVKKKSLQDQLQAVIQYLYETKNDTANTINEIKEQKGF